MYDSQSRRQLTTVIMLLAMMYWKLSLTGSEFKLMFAEFTVPGQYGGGHMC